MPASINTPAWTTGVAPDATARSIGFEGIDLTGEGLTTASAPCQRFHRNGTITSAAAGTAVPIVTAAEVGTGRKIYIEGFLWKVNGATAWSTTMTVLNLQDDAGTPIVPFQIPIASLTGNMMGTMNSLPGAGTYVTTDSLYTGLTAGKGLNLKADANAGAGSTIIWQCFGVIK